jgi:hypothetical protein
MVPPTSPAGDGLDPEADHAEAMKRAQQRQAQYAARRRDWAERVGRPYHADADQRPPPGELDVADDE